METAKHLNSPDTFVQYAKVTREVEAKKVRLLKIRDERQTSRIVTYSNTVAFALKYLLPLVPVLWWYGTPMFFIPSSGTEYSPPTEINVMWWTLLCNAVSNRLATILS